MSIMTPNSLKPTNLTLPLATIGHVNEMNSNSSNDDNEIFKLLVDSTNGMSKLRQFIFYMGTSCDGKTLRSKLKKLQEVLYQNILKQRESIVYFFNRSNKTPTHHKFKDSELIRFTLTSLAYFESLIQRQIYLLNTYPLEDYKS